MAGRGTVLTILYLLSAFSSAFGDCGNFTRSLDGLLAEYDRNVLPAAVQVSATMEVRHATIYEASASVRLLANLHLNWVDERLKWNLSDWSCNSSLISAERLWIPDVIIKSVAINGGVSDGNLRAKLWNDGKVEWVQRLDLTAPLTMHMFSWPMDQHVTTYKFASRSYTDEEMKLTSQNDLLSPMLFVSGTWELVSVKGSQSKSNGAVVLSWEVTLRRRAAAHFLTAVTVLAASMLLLIAALILPAASRSALCGAAAVITVFWMMATSARVAGAGSTPLRLQLAAAVCVGAGVAAAGAAVALRLARRSTPPPRLLRSLLLTVNAPCRLTVAESSEGENSVWASAAQLLDRCLSVALLLMLFVVFCLCL